MNDFDFFGERLFDEAKFYYEKSVKSNYNEEKQMFLHASLLLGMSALEAYINSVCIELVETETFNLDLYEKMLLSERNIELNKGIASLGNQLKMTRLIDKIEYLYCKFSHKQIEITDDWNSGIKEAIHLRNSLVHPKKEISITEKQIHNVLNSILETVNTVFKVVYKRNVPIYNYGLQSVKDYKE